MSNKYQIFVSSTFIDLKDQRDVIIKSILEMGHIPVGMEMFSAADEEQWGIIKRQIDQSDYYVVILANRYGSTTDDGVSYTEKEYDYAKAQGIPTLGFVLERSASWPSQFTDTDAPSVSSLSLFKEKVQKKHVSFWKNVDDLYGKCAIALTKAFTAYPREGWIRASQYTDANLSAELARLSAENASLRKTIKEYGNEDATRKKNEVQENIRILEANERKMHIWYNNSEAWSEVDPKTLFTLFLYLAPEMIVEKSLEDLSRFAAHVVCGVEPTKFRNEFPIPQNSVKGWMTDFSTLGLAKPSDIKKAVSDQNEYWSLTDKGKEFLNIIRKVQLISNANKKDGSIDAKNDRESLNN